MKCNHVCIIVLPEGEESEQGIKNVFEEIMAENFPNLVKEKDTQVQEMQSPKQNEPKMPTPKHPIIKMANVKDKERILNTATER